MRVFQNIEELAACTGQIIGHSEWLTITQELIDRFAEVTGDHQWIHVDPERCRRELGTDTIAHGYLLASLIARFAQQIYRVEGVSRAINYGLDTLRFVGPVSPGDRVRGLIEPQSVSEEEGRVRVVNKATVEREGHERPALVAYPITLIYL